MTTSDIESSNFASKSISRMQNQDGSWTVTTSIVYSDGTKKEVTEQIQSVDVVVPSSTVNGPTTSTTTEAPTHTTLSVGNSVAAKPHPRVSVKATASMWCGIVGIFILGLILGPIAIILGVCAKYDIAAHPDELEGECQAKTGIICGCVALLLWLTIIVWAVSG